MIDDFLQHTLARVDDLAELKVSLVALRLLELKQSEVASVTARELAAHPALRDGLGFAPQIALNAALQRAVARGTLLTSSSSSGSLGEPRYFLNTDAGRRAVDAIEAADGRHAGASGAAIVSGVGRALATVAREVEWLESIDAYAPTPADEHAVEEWLALGYTQEEIVRGVREALNTPRPRGTPARTLATCARQLTAQPPDAPTAYYRVAVARSSPPPDEVVAFRELAQRWPDGHEYNLIQAAAGIYGAGAVVDMLKRLVTRQRADVDALLPLLTEREEADLALAREQAQPDLLVRSVVQLYESTFGLPPTSHIAQDIQELSEAVKDMEVWQGVFRYAATQNKREWNYVRKLLLNPSPAIYEPAPVNEAAQFAFQLYKRRVSRGILDPSVAREINELALQVTDPTRWTDAVDKAARANALRWDYIRNTLIGPAKGSGSEARDGRRKHGAGAAGAGGARKGGVNRRPQVGEPTEEELEAARERARKRIAERTRRNAPGQGGATGS